jgi:hypothetical protein
MPKEIDDGDTPGRMIFPFFLISVAPFSVPVLITKGL